MEVKIKRLVEDAVIPTYAHDTDAGLDLVATSYEYKENIDCHVYGTGLAVEIPEGYVGLIYPRSSNRKTDAYMCNHVGVIDSGYRGEVMISFKLRDSNIKSISQIFEPYEVGHKIAQLIKPYEVGDKVAQLIIMPYPKIKFVEVDKLSDSDRGENGHGSSGN